MVVENVLKNVESNIKKKRVKKDEEVGTNKRLVWECRNIVVV